MKITKVNYINGDARFIIDAFPKSCFSIKLEGTQTKEQILEQLNIMIQRKLDRAADPELIYNNLGLKQLEGDDI